MSILSGASVSQLLAEISVPRGARMMAGVVDAGHVRDASSRALGPLKQRWPQRPRATSPRLG